ncbi:MAG: hypothetical protein IIY88_03915 [Eubacterium sp.]|nr:hypothetical protein [Eubacterium sp.]
MKSDVLKMSKLTGSEEMNNEVMETREFKADEILLVRAEIVRAFLETRHVKMKENAVTVEDDDVVFVTGIVAVDHVPALVRVLIRKVNDECTFTLTIPNIYELSVSEAARIKMVAETLGCSAMIYGRGIIEDKITTFASFYTGGGITEEMLDWAFADVTVLLLKTMELAEIHAIMHDRKNRSKDLTDALMRADEIDDEDETEVKVKHRAKEGNKLS